MTDNHAVFEADKEIHITMLTALAAFHAAMPGIPYICIDLFLQSKYKLNKQHIAHRAACNGQKHLPFPQVQQNNNGNRNKLRQTVASAENADIFQAIDHQ